MARPTYKKPVATAPAAEPVVDAADKRNDNGPAKHATIKKASDKVTLDFKKKCTIIINGVSTDLKNSELALAPNQSVIIGINGEVPPTFELADDLKYQLVVSNVTADSIRFEAIRLTILKDEMPFIK